MTAFLLKIIACITMFIDHIGYVIFDGSSFFNWIGRLAFPIFAFQISQGYIHTRNLKRYAIRLFIFALISQIPFTTFYKNIFDAFAINVIFTLLFGLISIIVYDKVNKILGLLVTICLAVIAQICDFDYGFYGVAIILLFYMFRNSKPLLISAFSFATIIRYGYHIVYYLVQTSIKPSIIFEFYMPSLIATLLSAVFIGLYNGKKGRDSKYLLYLFYPLHLLLIYFINVL